jgi:hypothetical protein
MKSLLHAVNLEKRKHPRFSVDLPVEYWKIYNPLSQSSRLVNISEGGVLIHLYEPMEIGQNLKLKVSPDARLDSIKALVQVIWKDTDFGNQEGYRVGAKFLGISSEDMEKLKDFLSSLINSASHSSKILSKIGSILPGFFNPDRGRILNRKVQR